MSKDHTTLFDLLEGICPDIANKISTVQDGSSEETPHNTRNPQTGRTTLHEAAANGDHTTVRHLIENGSDVNKPTFLGGDTALHIAASREHSDVIKEIMRHNDADPNIRNKYKATPLHYAKSAAIAKLLLSHGAALDLLDSNNNTPLQSIVARPMSERNTELIKYLTEMTEDQTRAQTRKDLKDSRKRRRRAEAIKAKQREREEAERVQLLHIRRLSEYKTWRGTSSAS